MDQVKEDPRPAERGFRGALRQALRDELTQPQLLVLLLIYVEQLSITEAAMVLRLGEDETRAMFDTARERMRQAVIDERLPMPGRRDAGTKPRRPAIEAATSPTARPSAKAAT